MGLSHTGAPFHLEGIPWTDWETQTIMSHKCDFLSPVDMDFSDTCIVSVITFLTMSNKKYINAN